MAATTSFSAKFGLGVLPEYEPKDNQQLYNELARLRGAIRTIAFALDSYAYGGAVPSGYITYGNGIGLAVSSSFTFDTSLQQLKVPGISTGSFSCNATQLGFYTVASAPIVRPVNTIGPAAIVINAGVAVNALTTYGGYTMAQIAAALVALGLLT